MSGRAIQTRVGSVRPSQLLSTFGVGSVVDLPHLSVMVMGLDDWPIDRLEAITEERLLAAVRKHLGPQVERLCAAPIALEESGAPTGPADGGAMLGVPVATFPRWLRCSKCRFLGPVDCGVFGLKPSLYRPEETLYVHSNCATARGRPPAAIPARFVVACQAGHLDDFPWVEFLHKDADCKASLRMEDVGTSGEASDVRLTCDTCDRSRRMSDAVGEEARKSLPACRGHRLHLRDHAQKPCEEPLRTLLLGASNAWFALILSALSVPSSSDKLSQLVEDHWTHLEEAESRDTLAAILRAFQKSGQLSAFKPFEIAHVWKAVEQHRSRVTGGTAPQATLLKGPEWKILSAPEPSLNAPNFRLRPVPAPERYAKLLEKVVLAERLREVRALIGFTRIESPGNLGDVEPAGPDHRAPICRGGARWVPACEVRGEGIFLQFNESALASWMPAAAERDGEFRNVHCQVRRARKLEPDARVTRFARGTTRRAR